MNLNFRSYTEIWLKIKVGLMYAIFEIKLLQSSMREKNVLLTQLYIFILRLKLKNWHKKSSHILVWWYMCKENYFKVGFL